MDSLVIRIVWKRVKRCKTWAPRKRARRGASMCARTAIWPAPSPAFCRSTSGRTPTSGPTRASAAASALRRAQICTSTAGLEHTPTGSWAARRRGAATTLTQIVRTEVRKSLLLGIFFLLCCLKYSTHGGHKYGSNCLIGMICSRYFSCKRKHLTKV